MDMLEDGDRFRVLVIDDNAGIRLVVRLNLEQHNYEVVEADNGSDGLALALAEPPDAIILDLMMPGVDGFQVLEELRRDRRTKEVPVVVLTAVSTTSVHEQVRFLGANEVVTKPFHDGELGVAIRDHIGRWRGRVHSR